MNNKIKKPYRMATGVGSFPHKKVDEALDLIFTHLPLIPHWPQLPALSDSEGFVEQYLHPLVKIGAIKYKEQGSPYFDSENSSFLDILTKFYELYLKAKDNEKEAGEHFVMSSKFASGFHSFTERLEKEGTGPALFLKGQISGPVTVGLRLTDGKRQPSFYRQELRDLLTNTLELQLDWQIKELKKFGLPVIIFIDDPGLCFFGQASYIGLSREEIQESLRTLVETIHGLDALAGVHVCSGIDWNILTELQVDIINVDAVKYFEPLLVYIDTFKEFYEKGGLMAWGVIPTDQRIEEENKETVLERLHNCLDTLSQKGIPRSQLEEQLMITPSCGTGTLTRELGEKIYAILGEIQSKYL
ncbi:MAG: hypothetical protein D5R97_04310 [Candidatus Syntrophonatronum acetioxidans]|uniref:Methionine synthase n=1 Tax=Candidatus Syntrophonatronum acetioxidans TaxID=1795816 RepID=A0A424YFH7_9FIRM|nr:MAG: hypothetical protein D5R97_04310 [Candidatus Syntrophonatronum acetioxidans]